MKNLKLIELSETEKDSLVVGAKNIRLELKANFPGIKFEVRTSRFSMGNSIDIKWIDGPTSKQVDSITGKYSAGSFDGMVDLYTYSTNDHTKRHGSGKYVMATRDYSDGLVEKVIAELKREYVSKDASVTVENFRSGKLWQITPIGNTQGDYHWGWDQLIHRALQDKSCKAKAVASVKAVVKEVKPTTRAQSILDKILSD